MCMLTVVGSGMVDDSTFLDYSCPFFLLIQFHCTFSISYKILKKLCLLLLYFN